MAKIVSMHVVGHGNSSDNFLLAVKADDIISVQYQTIREGRRVTLVCLEGQDIPLHVSHEFHDMVRKWEDALC